MKYKSVILALVLGAVLLSTQAVYALINPNFTPIHVVKQSDLVLELKFEADVKDGKAVAAVKREIKGKNKGQTVQINISGAYKEQIDAFTRMLKITSSDSALLFVGIFCEVGSSVEEKKGMLHIGGKWVNLSYDEAKAIWLMDKIDDHLQATWAGGTDMLIRAVDYIMADPDLASVPVEAGVEWAEKKVLGKIDGKIYSMVPVRLYNDENVLLFISAQKGDKLYFYDAKSKAFKDITDKSRINTKSAVHVWGDFNSDGLLDLVSFDGKDISLLTQSADKTFKAEPLKPQDLLKDKSILGFAAIDCGKGLPGIITSTNESPVLWFPNGAKSAEKLCTGEFPGKDLGTAGKCMVADLTGDNIPDVIQLFEKGGLFYQGKKPGSFAQPVTCQIGLGKGFSEIFLGDYDADGLLDIFTVTESRCRLWHNLGSLKFMETLGLAGEIAYISKPGGTGGMTGDINNDGRQDILIIYPDNPYQIFFNRGFRSFGHGRQLNAEEKDMFPEANEGQKAGCLGDLNNDGTQDLAVVINDGTVGVLLGTQALSLHARLTPKSSYLGPITVTGWSDKRCIGAWNVTPGTGEAFFGQYEAGPCTVKWQLPEGTLQSKEFILEKNIVDFILK